MDTADDMGHVSYQSMYGSSVVCIDFLSPGGPSYSRRWHKCALRWAA